MSASRSFAFRLVAAGATDIGRRRKHNEDAILLRPDLNLFLLADGAGGHNAGNVASALATTSIANFFEVPVGGAVVPERVEVDDFGLWVAARRLAIAVQKANRDIVEIAKTSKQRKGMGSTIVAASLSPTSGMLHLAHVGDSRCYRLREGRLEQLTKDHSLINDVLELRPDMSDEAIKKLPTNVVTRALGMEGTVRVSVRSHAVAPGDKYLLCSDGLSGAVPPSELTEILCMPNTPGDLVERLIAVANEAGGHDNIAAVVIACELGTGVSVPAHSMTTSSSTAASSALASAVTSASGAFTAPMLLDRGPSTEAAELRGATIPDGVWTPTGDRDGSLPEILLVGIEDADLEQSAGVRVLPAASASAGMLDAIDDFVGSMRLQSQKSADYMRDPEIHHGEAELDDDIEDVDTSELIDQIVCAGCGETIESPFCPYCGESWKDGSGS